ncbi:MAG: cobalt transporter [Oscillospiraceae bacterium]|nr:cobalt transporter [Oscillospiraceae bacterium]
MNMHLPNDSTGGAHSHAHSHSHTHEHSHDGHTHSHAHDHTHSHDHDHPHDHDHLHGHDHAHDHSHDCAHGCDHCHTPCEHTPMEELVALMKYMVGHNAAHARELAELAEQLEKAGSHVAYEQVMAAVSDFEKGNLRLSAVLASLDVK